MGEVRSEEYTAVEDPSYQYERGEAEDHLMHAPPPMMVSEPRLAEPHAELKVERFAREMRNRTFALALEIVDVMNETPDSHSLKVIRYQLLKSAASVMANYRAVCRARSDNEFFSKMSIVVEEADECVGWLGLLLKSRTIKIDKSHVETLMNEALDSPRFSPRQEPPSTVV